jgi:PhnB protein
MAGEMLKSPMNGVVPYITVSDAKEAIGYYASAFGAKEIDRRAAEDGRLMHAHVEINGGAFMFSDPFPEWGVAFEPVRNVVLHLIVADAAPWWTRAVDAGLDVVMPLDKAFWGDFYGQLRDRYGITWAVVAPTNGAA